jgi:hypothetical protein
MAREIARVKAPLNFEDSLLREIGKRKLNSSFARIRRLWIYNFEWPSRRTLTWSSCSVALLLMGGIYAFHRFSLELPRQPIPLQASTPKAAAPVQKADNFAKVVNSSQSALPAVAAAAKPKRLKSGAPAQMAEAFPDEIFGDQQEAEYLEYFSQGPNNPPVVIRWPLPVQMQSHRQPEKEYFIQNVSH